MGVGELMERVAATGLLSVYQGASTYLQLPRSHITLRSTQALHLRSRHLISFSGPLKPYISALNVAHRGLLHMETKAAWA